VRRWGRENRVRGGLPGAVRSMGAPLLAGPVRLRFTGERPLTWSRTTLSPNPRRIEWDARARRGGTLVRTRSSIEYDGFWQVATRKLLQSIYERVKELDPDVRIFLHTSGALMYPYVGFGDMMLDGEQLRRPLTAARGDYMDILSLT
jgi:hypothetical protein